MCLKKWTSKAGYILKRLIGVKPGYDQSYECCGGGAALFSLLNDIGIFFRESYQRMNIWRRHLTIVKRTGTIGQSRWWSKDVALKKTFGSFNTQLERFFTEIVTAICFCFDGTFRPFFAEAFWSPRHFCHLSHSCIKIHRSSIDQQPIYSGILPEMT